MQTLNTANYGATLAQAAKHLAAFEPFHTGTLSAAWEPDEEMRENGIDVSAYVVRSYGVTIAIHDGEEPALNVLAYNYSVTTSKHTNMVKKAWGLN